MEIELRRCGLCRKKDIPLGVDWPWWTNGKPVHGECQREEFNRLTSNRVIIFERELMEHEHLYLKPTPISNNAKVEFVPIGVSRQLERSSRELAATNFELQNQKKILEQAFLNFVLATEKFLASDGDHTGWHRKDLAHCPICQQFDLALNVAKFITKP